LVHRLTQREFREDTARSKQQLEEQCGRRVHGYRAAEFSIGSSNLWALEVLAELGFDYDSSIFPVRHRRYGIRGFFPLPARYALPNGGEMVEIPLAAARVLGASIPVAGGGYFRLLPQGSILRVIAGLNREHRPAVTYFHPYEFDPQRLEIFATARPKKAAAKLRAARFGFHQNLRRTTMPAKLERLLQNFRFVACEDYLKEAQLGERRELLSAAG
jgi:polysaccharide deacetylase family protein (PEP-CTERM system associated)